MGFKDLFRKKKENEPPKPEQEPEADFSAALCDFFERVKKPCVGISSAPARAPLDVGVSKLGGRPDVPASFVWPRYTGEDYAGVTADRPLSFMAQFDLAQVRPMDTDGLLPETGLLSFFYEMQTQNWGFDPADRGCARVYYFEDTSDLAPAAFPEDLAEECRFPEREVTFAPRVTVPGWEECAVLDGYGELSARFPEEVNDWEKYCDLSAEYGAPTNREGTDATQLLGWPCEIQGTMERECEMASRGIYCGSGPVELPPQQKQDIAAASRDWILLFQMDSVNERDSTLMFGDDGYIYYWVRRQDLAERKFDDVWLILQCG